MTRTLALAPLLLLAACNAAPDNRELAEAESRQSREAVASGRIDCALEGADMFGRTCTLDEMTGADGTVLVVGRSDVGYRRLRITTDGRGVISADGAEPAAVTIIGQDLIEVAIGNDRYRLPASVGSSRLD